MHWTYDSVSEDSVNGSHLIMHRTNGVYWTPNPGLLVR